MRTREEPLDPRVEADLATIDRSLAGAQPATDDDRVLAELALLLREERPEPGPAWSRSLDQRAAAGFPRGGARGPGGGNRSSWLGGGGWMVPAGAVATLAIVVVVATNLGDTGQNADKSSSGASTAREGSTATAESADVGAAVSADTGSPSGEAATASPDTAFRLGAGRRSADKIAPGAENRKVDRNAQLTLAAQPDEVRPVTDELISITRSLGGIVASSQVSETADGDRATLELTIPTRNLDTALDRMTDLADVDSLNEASEDITKPFVSAQDQVKDAKAKREELLEALGNATTDAEAAALEIRIADARREIARAEARLDRIARQARLSDLSVTVVGDANASDERSLGDWADDALDVLRGLAGVLLIAAAILVPLGLIAAVICLIAAAVRRRRRDRALDQP